MPIVKSRNMTPDLGRGVDEGAVLHQAERVRADDDARHQEPDDRHQAEPEAEVGDGRGGEKERHRVGEKGVLHACRHTHSRRDDPVQAGGFTNRLAPAR